MPSRPIIFLSFPAVRARSASASSAIDRPAAARSAAAAADAAAVAFAAATAAGCVRVRAYLWGEEGAVVSTCMHLASAVGWGRVRAYAAATAASSEKASSSGAAVRWGTINRP